MIQAVSLHFPTLDIVVGGQGFLCAGKEVIHKYPRVECVASITNLEKLIHNE